MALVLAMAGWLAFVPGATWEHATHTAEIEVQGLPPGYRLVEVVPRTVEVSVVGPRRRLLLTSSSAFRVAVDASAVAQGQRTLGIDASSVRHYTGLDVVAVRPDKVHLVVEPGAAPPPGPR